MSVLIALSCFLPNLRSCGRSLWKERLIRTSFDETIVCFALKGKHHDLFMLNSWSPVVIHTGSTANALSIVSHTSAENAMVSKIDTEFFYWDADRAVSRDYGP